MSRKKEAASSRKSKETDSYHHGDLRNALIEAGIRLLRKVDAHELSLRSLAKEAGVSHAAPYRHFPDKETLLAAIAHQGFIKLGGQIEKVLSSHAADPKEWLPGIAWAYFRFASESPEHFRVMFGGFVTDPKKYEEFEWVGKRLFESVVSIMSRCQQAGVLPPGDPLVLALAYWSKIHGFTQLMLANQLGFLDVDSKDGREWFRRILEIR